MTHPPISGAGHKNIDLLIAEKHATFFFSFPGVYLLAYISASTGKSSSILFIEFIG
jgi:hypothetical protein